MENLNLAEKINNLCQARDLLSEAIDLVKQTFPNDGNVRSYWIDQVAEHLHKENQYNLDIEDLMNRVYEEQK